MVKVIATALLIVFCAFNQTHGQNQFEKDVISTSGGDLEIVFLGHGTVMFTYGEKIIHVDPFSKVADYSTLPKADIILITHHHRDHLDPAALQQVGTEHAAIVLTEIGAGSLGSGSIMKNGDHMEIEGIKIEAVPAYNLIHKRQNGQFFHPRGEGNGYILTFGNTRIYIAGDTENTPEMKGLKGIDVAFLPMNLPYTMTPEMVADGARAFKPGILYPYHYGNTDPAHISKLLKDTPDVEVRIRRMQ